MGQSAAKQQPERQYSWLGLHQAEECTDEELLIRYGRAVNSSREAPLFEDEPTMCRCCPKCDHIFLPNFTSGIAAFKLSKLITLLEKAQTDEDKQSCYVPSKRGIEHNVSFKFFNESLNNAYEQPK